MGLAVRTRFAAGAAISPASLFSFPALLEVKRGILGDEDIPTVAFRMNEDSLTASKLQKRKNIQKRGSKVVVFSKFPVPFNPFGGGQGLAGPWQQGL